MTPLILGVRNLFIPATLTFDPRHSLLSVDMNALLCDIFPSQRRDLRYAYTGLDGEQHRIPYSVVFVLGQLALYLLLDTLCYIKYDIGSGIEPDRLSGCSVRGLYRR